MQRRQFVKASVFGGVAIAVGSSWPRLLGAQAAGAGPYGALSPADSLGLELPAGFSSRVVATAGQIVPGTPYTWHGDPDGGACFPLSDGGWVYVSNSEMATGEGGASMVRFDAGGQIVDARRILTGTNRNCSGGPTPWGTWLSCEETTRGRVYECDPLGTSAGVARPMMGRFRHEAAAVDVAGRVVYLTEDQPDGGLYRFRPDVWPNLSAGVLEVLVDDGGTLGWADVPDPSGADVPTRDQVPGTRRFNGGEGAWFDTGLLYFTTKGDNRVSTYDPTANELRVIYDDTTSPGSVLTGVDNITVSRSGDVFVAEDSSNLELVILSPEGDVAPFLRLTGVTGSELTGPAFDPSGTRLYFSSQRNPGRTYEITGPFRSTPGGTTTTTATTTTTSTTTAPPSDTVTLTARGYTEGGVQHVELTWSGAATLTVRVKRNGAVVAQVANNGSYVDTIGPQDGGKYRYRVCEIGGARRCSNKAVVAF